MRHLITFDEQMSQRIDPPPAWHRAEKVLREEFDLTEDHGPYYDARQEDGTPVECKSCVCYYDDGRVGKFEVWESQINQLSPGGKVALLVYDRSSRKNVIATRQVGVSDLLTEGTREYSQHPTMGLRIRRRIEWPDIIPLDEIFFWSSRRFAKEYDEEEVANTILPAPREGEPPLPGDERYTDHDSD